MSHGGISTHELSLCHRQFTGKLTSLVKDIKRESFVKSIVISVEIQPEMNVAMCVDKYSCEYVKKSTSVSAKL